MPQNDIVLFTGNANPLLAEKIAKQLGVAIEKAIVSRFSDGETRVELESTVRGRDVFIIQSTCAPANENIMELLIMLDTIKRASPDRVTAVIPYYGYGRQERKTAPRTPITAKLVADLISAAGVHRVLTLELHTASIQGFFDIPVDHLFCKPVFYNYFKNLELGDSIVVSPDAGGTERARALAKVLNLQFALIDKRRLRPNESEVMNVIGDVKGKTAIIVDDIIDTGGSLVSAAQALKDQGAVRVLAAVTHGVLSGPAIDRLEKSCLEKLILSDSIPLASRAANCSKIEVLSVSRLLAEGIQCIHNDDSISRLFI